MSEEINYHEQVKEDLAREVLAVAVVEGLPLMGVAFDDEYQSFKNPVFSKTLRGWAYHFADLRGLDVERAGKHLAGAVRKGDLVKVKTRED